LVSTELLLKTIKKYIDFMFASVKTDRLVESTSTLFRHRSTSACSISELKLSVLLKQRAANVTTKWLRSNQLLTGELRQGDRQLPRARSRWTDEYRLPSLRVGQTVRLQLKSHRFSPALQLIDRRTGQLLVQNRSIHAQIVHTRLNFTVQPEIRYAVRVTSQGPAGTGTYQLQAVLPQRGSNNGLKHFSYDIGYGLINAAAAVARAIGRKPFAEQPATRFWSLDQIKVPEVWTRGFTGKNVVVAVLDSGVDYRHPDLANNIWTNSLERAGNGIDDDNNGFIDDQYGWDFVDDDSNEVMDDFGHGTHVAGIIAARRNKIGMTGVAPNAKIMPIKVIGGQDDGAIDRFDANLAAGIRYAVQNGAHVLNISLGNFPHEPPLPLTKAALQIARQAGLVAVMASGNERLSDNAIRPIEPALYAANALGIAVGAVDQWGTVADFSNPAGDRKLNFVVAPGVGIRSTVPGGYDIYDGTSMATPYVTGTVALMLSANPRLSPARVERLLMATTARRGTNRRSPL
jgi:subtilisin family serine protease